MNYEKVYIIEKMYIIGIEMDRNKKEIVNYEIVNYEMEGEKMKKEKILQESL